MLPNRIVPWGLRQAVIVDPEARRWEILRQLADVPPAAWGAVRAPYRDDGPRPGSPRSGPDAACR